MLVRPEFYNRGMGEGERVSPPLPKIEMKKMEGLVNAAGVECLWP